MELRSPRRPLLPLFAAALAAGLLTAGPAESQMAVRAEYQGRGSFPLPAEDAAGGADEASGLAVGPEGELYVADREGAVHVFAEDGSYRRTYRSLLRQPRAVAVDSTGQAYVLDGDRKQVAVVDPKGEVIRLISASGDKDGQLDDPIDLALGPGGHVYVLDKGQKRISVFSVDGTFIRQLPLEGALEEPRGLSVGNDGSVYVADKSEAAQLWVFPPFPEWPWFGASPRDVGETIAFRGRTIDDAVAVAVNDFGTAVVASPESGILLSRNRFVETSDDAQADDKIYGGRGSQRGAFRRIVDIAMAGDDEIYILDREVRKVEHIRLTTERDLAPRPAFRHPIGVSHAPSVSRSSLLAVSYGGGDRGPYLFTTRKDDGLELEIYESRPSTYPLPGAGTVRYHTARSEALVRSIAQREADRIGGIAVNDTMIAVTHPGKNHFALFDRRNGARIGTFGDAYEDRRRLDDPRGIGILSDGRIVVADKGNGRIKVFSPDLASLLGSYAMENAYGVAVSPDDDVYVWNEEGKTVGRMPMAQGEEFRPLRRGVEQFNKVAHVAVDRGGNLFLLDRESSRIAVVRPDDFQVLTQIGAEETLEEPRRIVLDREGNIYAVDDANRRTAVFGWRVDLPAPSGMAVTYGDSATRVRWDAAPGHLLESYRVEAADQPEGAYEVFGTAAQAGLDVSLSETGGSPPRYLRVRPVSVTGHPGGASSPVPLLNLTAVAAHRAADHERALSDASGAVDRLEAGEVQGEPGVQRSLARIAFESARALRRHEVALEWGRRLVESAPPERLPAATAGLVEVQLGAGTPGAARETLMGLRTAGAGPGAFRDSALVALSFRVARSLGDTASHEATIGFLQQYRSGLPSDTSLDSLRSVYRDSISVYQTRDRLRTGFRHWRNAQYSQAITFLQGQLEQSDLSPRQEIVSRQLLAAIYFAFGRRGDARAQFQQIYAQQPDFDIDENARRMEELYGVSIYNSSMREFFGGMRPADSGS